MKKIVAIGGGEIGRKKPDGGKFPIETRLIDEEIIKLTGKKHPKALLLPTASGDHPAYWETFQKYYGEILKCEVDVLYLLKNKLTYSEIKKKILGSDIIYVGGGNTLKMLKLWRRLGIDNILQTAHKKGIVLSGLSAGSICWFKNGISDSLRSINPKAPLIKVRGLNIINTLHCPHYDTEADRKGDLKKMMKKTSGVAIALENCCALEVVDDKYKIIVSKKSAKAHKVYWDNNVFFDEILKVDKIFHPINDLISK